LTERNPTEARMVAMQLTCDEGAFICNVLESDVVKMASRELGSFVVMHCAIRLDAMSGVLYEIHRIKSIETNSIDFYQPFRKRQRGVRTPGKIITLRRQENE